MLGFLVLGGVLLACSASVAEAWTVARARSAHGMVVSASPIAAGVGAGILERGGNAVDAAVATAFALAVAEPSMSGLGGRTQVLIRLPKGSFEGIDGTTELPAGAPRAAIRGESHSGYASIGVPGTVAALARAHSRHGRLAWPEVLGPAITLAREGFALPAGEAKRIAAVAGQLRAFPGSRGFLDAEGKPLPPGGRLVQRDLARVLESLASSGPDEFYRGWIANRIAKDMARNGGDVTLGDLARYQPRPSEVVRGRYRGSELTATYLPASGATTIEALQILELFDVSPETPAWIATTARALRLSFEDRDVDSRSPESRAQELTSLEWARRRAGHIRRTALAPVHADRQASGGWDASTEPPHTSHLSVADEQGMLVALTQSLGPSMGSKVTTPGLGFLYAATNGYLGLLEPGGRTWSSQSPLIVTRAGQPVCVLGAAGARRIISSLVAVISRMIDAGEPLTEAIAQPRFHPTTERLYVEARGGAMWRDEDLAELRRLGFDPVPRSRGSYFARIHGIEVDAATGEYVGVADPRGDGVARGAYLVVEANTKLQESVGPRGHAGVPLNVGGDGVGGAHEQSLPARAPEAP